MEISVIENGDPTLVAEAPSTEKGKLESVKKKRRRGKSKRKVMKPYIKLPWQDRKKNDKSKRNNRLRKIVMTKTHAPFNNNQFLMEIHKPEPENSFNNMQTPSARTRDSSFSVDSEDNYFFSLPEDEEEYLTKEFSSVYEDAQTERLSSMSKTDLIEEYLLLEAKYDNLVKRTERIKSKYLEDEKDTTVTDRDTSLTDRDSMITDRDTSGNSIESVNTDGPSIADVLQQMKEQEEKIRELQLNNEKLKVENEHLRQKANSSSEDSESDSSSTSVSDSSSSRSASPIVEPQVSSDNLTNGILVENGSNEVIYDTEVPLVNGFHSPTQ